MRYHSVSVEEHQNIATITVNRPSKLNALNIETIEELHHALKKANKDKKTKVIIITGSGEKAFVAVADISMIDANQALAYGLVNHVTTQDELLPFCEKIASKITRNSPVAITAAIKAINANYEDGINGFEVEIEEFGNCFGTDDFAEGTSAFLEKRKADFSGE